MALNHTFSNASSRQGYVSQLLRHIFWRRIQECSEQKEWVAIMPPDMGYRRKVYELIIWIGTNTNRELLNVQQSVLSREPINGEAAVIGWSATEDQYPCRTNSTVCNNRTHGSMEG